jgi:hypothetical protein
VPLTPLLERRSGEGCWTALLVVQRGWDGSREEVVGEVEHAQACHVAEEGGDGAGQLVGREVEIGKVAHVL